MMALPESAEALAVLPPPLPLGPALGEALLPALLSLPPPQPLTTRASVVTAARDIQPDFLFMDNHLFIFFGRSGPGSASCIDNINNIQVDVNVYFLIQVSLKILLF
jgi:hypothetical protein